MSMHPVSCDGRGFKKQVTPKNTDFSSHENFIYSISVGAANKSLEDVIEAYRWAKDYKKYPVKAILVGDGLYKITLRIIKGLSVLDAEVKAIEAGIELINDFISKACTAGVSFIKTSELLLDPEFERAYQGIEALFSGEQSFRASLEKDARFYVDRQKLRGTLKVSEYEAIKLSIFYLKQEIAVYLLLAERGWAVDLYLGHEIPTLAKIMNQEISAAPDALKRRVNIGLQKKKAKQPAPDDICAQQPETALTDSTAPQREPVLACSA